MSSKNFSFLFFINSLHTLPQLPVLVTIAYQATPLLRRLNKNQQTKPSCILSPDSVRVLSSTGWLCCMWYCNHLAVCMGRTLHDGLLIWLAVGTELTWSCQPEGLSLPHCDHSMWARLLTAKGLALRGSVPAHERGGYRSLMAQPPKLHKIIHHVLLSKVITGQAAES